MIVLLLYSLFKSFCALCDSLFIISGIFSDFITFLISASRRALSFKSER